MKEQGMIRRNMRRKRKRIDTVVIPVESEEEESSGFGEGEPAPKKSRLLTENHDPPINRSYSQIGSKFCVGITKVYSFISGLSSPLFSSKDMADSPDSSGQSLRVNVGGSRKSSRGKGLAESTTTAGEHFTRDKDPGPSGLDLTSSLMTNDDDIQFLGASSRTGYTDAPTKRPALGRRATAPEHSQPPVPSINPNFRFSPTISPTAPQAPPDLTLRPTSKEPSWFKNSLAGRKVSYLNKRPGSLGRNPIKSLNEKCYGIQKKKQIRSTFLFHRGNSCAEESFRYEDKANYQQLLQQYTESSVLPSSSSNSTSPIGCITQSRFNSFWTDEKRRQLEDTLSASRLSSTLAVDATASSDLATEKKSSTSDILLVDLVKAESTVATDSETDSVIFVKELTKPVSRSNSLESIIQESPVYNTDWLKSLRVKYGNRSRATSDEAELAAEMQKRFEERRVKCHSSLEDRITHRMKFLDLTFPSKVEEIQPEEEGEEEEELVPLTSQMEDVIDNALQRSRDTQKVLIEKFNIQITRRDIATLSGLNWLNDEVINFYMNLLVDRGKNDNYPSVYAFNTFFYPKLVKTGHQSVRRWTKKVDVFSYNLLLVPVHLGMHWCLATIDFRDKAIRYYDSMLGDNHRCLEALLKYLQSEHLDKKSTDYYTRDWTLENIKDIPQQMNGSDCGMFACKFAEYLSRNALITFDQQHMPYFRRRMVYEIVSGALL